MVNYPVTLRLINPDSRVRAGMTAVATVVNQSAVSGWLVPATAVRSVDDSARVIVLRNGVPTPVTVTVGAPQGEWVVVESPELQANDRVIATTTSFINDENPFQFGPPGDGENGGPGGRAGGRAGGRPGGGG